MRYKLTVAIILGAAQLCGAQNALRDFESFRDSLFSGYHRYRQGILADYESFLRDTWHDYQIFKAPDSNNIPKPDRQPSMPERSLGKLRLTSTSLALRRTKSTSKMPRPWLPTAASSSAKDLTCLPLTRLSNTSRKTALLSDLPRLLTQAA